MFSRVVSGHSKGGVQDHIAMLTEGLVRKGYKVTIITSRHPDKEYEERNGVRIHYAGKGAIGNYSKEYFKESLRKFIEINKKEKFDVIHSQDVSAYYLVKKKLNSKLNIPLIVTMHGTSFDDFKTRMNTGLSIKEPIVSLREMAIFMIYAYRYLRREAPTIRGADKLIVTSDEQPELARKIYHLKKDKVMVIYNGVDTSYFVPGLNSEPLRKRYKLENKMVLLRSARLEKEKGVQTAIRAMKYIVKEKENAVLAVVGDGYYRKKLEKTARRLGLEKNIIFTGYVEFEELRHFFNLCDVFIGPTLRTGGYELTFTELMACGKALITTDIGGYPYLIKDNEDGFLVPKKDPKRTAEKALMLLKDEELRARIGKKAREKILKDFSIEKMIDKTIKAYKEAIEKHN